MYYDRLKVICPSDYAEILMAEAGEAGFETFLETDDGFEAYAEEEKVDNGTLELIQQKYSHVQPLLFLQDRIQKQNWNEEWEKSLAPIIVGDQCLVRADFHAIEKKYPYEIVITPKMSFGTGHHETTHLMLQAQLSIDHKDKRVMDAGCGTAILSIMASKRGAKKVEAFDIDEWSMENGRENIENNHCDNIRIRRGTIRDFSWPVKFDILLANINRNILVDEMKDYASNLREGGLLLLSGFFDKDAPGIMEAASFHGLLPEGVQTRNTWASLLLKKRS